MEGLSIRKHDWLEFQMAHTDNMGRTDLGRDSGREPGQTAWWAANGAMVLAWGMVAAVV